MTAYQVAIYGYGSHGSDIQHIWDSKNPLWPARMFDDNDPYPERFGDVWERRDDYHWFIGVNDPKLREEMSWRTPRWAMPLVHPAAVIDDRCTFDKGVVVGANTTMIHAVYLGLHTHVNYNCGMTRTRVGNYTTIAPGVTIAGDVQIGHRVFIGIGASIGNLVTIGDDAIIGAGSVVLKDVPAGAKILGVHA